MSNKLRMILSFSLSGLTLVFVVLMFVFPASAFTQTTGGITQNYYSFLGEFVFGDTNNVAMTILGILTVVVVALATILGGFSNKKLRVFGLGAALSLTCIMRLLLAMAYFGHNISLGSKFLIVAFVFSFLLLSFMITDYSIEYFKTIKEKQVKGGNLALVIFFYIGVVLLILAVIGVPVNTLFYLFLGVTLAITLLHTKAFKITSVILLACSLVYTFVIMALNVPTLNTISAQMILVGLFTLILNPLILLLVIQSITLAMYKKVGSIFDNSVPEYVKVANHPSVLNIPSKPVSNADVNELNQRIELIKKLYQEGTIDKETMDRLILKEFDH